MRLQTKCPVCEANYLKQTKEIEAGKTILKKDLLHLPSGVEQISERIIGNYKFVNYNCGHLVKYDLADLSGINYAVESLDGKMLYKFQQEVVKFGRDANFRFLANLDMGLGKTPITCAIFKLFPKETLPAIVVCKSSLVYQWEHALYTWAEIMPEIVSNGKSKFTPKYCKIAVVSFDLLRRLEIDEETRKQYKTIVIDETQNIKAPDTKRTQEVRNLCRDIPNVIGLSGTPIKNNGTEYFTILNILRSDLYRGYRQFCDIWVENVWDGRRYKYGGIRNYERFRERNKDFIIRYTREEVMPDLPKIFRMERFCELGAEVEKAYKAEMKAFLEAYDGGEFDKPGSFMNLLAYMSRMRHLTGMAKVKPCLDYIEEFLLSTDRKIVVFCHHKRAMELLRLGIEKRRFARDENGEPEKDEKGNPIELYAPPMQYVSEMNAQERYDCIEKFKSPDNPSRILLASTLSIQEGVNLQPVSDCIMLERQWNPANEEQAEARFPRPGATADKINANYFIALGTIDEYLSELIERKRQYCKQAIGDDAVKWDETSLMKELAFILSTSGRRKWSL